MHWRGCFEGLVPFLLQAICTAGVASALAGVQDRLGKLIGTKRPDLAPQNMEYFNSRGGFGEQMSAVQGRVLQVGTGRG